VAEGGLCILRYRTSVPNLGCEILCLDHVARVLSASPAVNFVYRLRILKLSWLLGKTLGLCTSAVIVWEQIWCAELLSFLLLDVTFVFRRFHGILSYVSFLPLSIQHCVPLLLLMVSKNIWFPKLSFTKILKQFFYIISAISPNIQSGDTSHLSYLWDTKLVLATQTGYLLESFSGFFSQCFQLNFSERRTRWILSSLFPICYSPTICLLSLYNMSQWYVFAGPSDLAV
jgi:uncharacterized membrane protein